MSKLYIVGFGPGSYEHMTKRAVDVIEHAELVIGYTTYIEILKKYFPDKRYIATPMKQEKERCELAVEEAVRGESVALVSSGDSGIYGMAGIAIQIKNEKKAEIEIEVVPGVTAATAAAAALGAPLMHDFTVISLSDLMTPFDLIMKRVEYAAMGDFVVCLYNPKSRKRVEHLKKAAEVLLKYRTGNTPVGIVKNAGRDGEKICLTTLDRLKDAGVDMFCTVIVGNSTTYVEDNKMITERGYQNAIVSNVC